MLHWLLCRSGQERRLRNQLKVTYTGITHGLDLEYERKKSRMTSRLLSRGSGGKVVPFTELGGTAGVAFRGRRSRV